MPNKAIVIEITATTFTAIEISGGSGNPEINRWATEKLPEDGISGAFIKQLWRQRQFSGTRVIAMLPEALVRYQTLSFMALPEEQLAAAVKVEMESKAEATDIWKIVGNRRQGERIYVRVALVADQQLTKALEPIDQAGLEVLWSGFKSRGLQNFIFFHQDFRDPETKQFAYLDIGAGQSEYGVVTETNLGYRRELELGNADFAGGDAAATARSELLSELRLSAASSQSTGQAAADQLWLFGVDPTLLADLKKTLAESGLAVTMPEKTHLGGVKLCEQVPRLAPLIGLALDELDWNTRKDLRIYTLKQQRRERVHCQIGWALKWALAGGFLLLGGWLLMQAQLVENQKQQEWLVSQTEKLRRLERLEAKTRNNLGKIRKLEQWTDCQGRELEYLLALEGRLPAGTTITDLTLEDGKVKSLVGTAPSVSWLLTKLSGDPVLKKLQLKGNIMTTANDFEGFQLEEKSATNEVETK